MTYLLDTCVISEYVRKKPNSNVIRWLDDQDENHLFLSVVTLGELKKGIVKIEDTDTTRYQKLLSWFQIIQSRFSGRILAIEIETILIWAQFCGKSEANGNKLPVIDSLLAATARRHDLIIVTRNIDDFRFSRVETFNPW